MRKATKKKRCLSVMPCKAIMVLNLTKRIPPEVMYNLCLS